MKEETRELPHSLTLENRTLLKAGGVLRIDSFDEETIAAATGGGRLLIRGENLHIEALDVGRRHADGHRESDFFGVRRFREARRPFPPVPLINASAAENLRAFLAFCLLGAALGLFVVRAARRARPPLQKERALPFFWTRPSACSPRVCGGIVCAEHVLGPGARVPPVRRRSGVCCCRFDARPRSDGRCARRAFAAFAPGASHCRLLFEKRPRVWTVCGKKSGKPLAFQSVYLV